jgi:hypothetical protein
VSEPTSSALRSRRKSWPEWNGRSPRSPQPRREAAASRIFAGVHFRTDLVAGTQLGKEVAEYVLATALTPIVP